MRETSLGVPVARATALAATFGLACVLVAGCSGGGGGAKPDGGGFIPTDGGSSMPDAGVDGGTDAGMQTSDKGYECQQDPLTLYTDPEGKWPQDQVAMDLAAGASDFQAVWSFAPARLAYTQASIFTVTVPSTGAPGDAGPVDGLPSDVNPGQYEPPPFVGHAPTVLRTGESFLVSWSRTGVLTCDENGANCMYTGYEIFTRGVTPGDTLTTGPMQMITSEEGAAATEPAGVPSGSGALLTWIRGVATMSGGKHYDEAPMAAVVGSDGKRAGSPVAVTTNPISGHTVLGPLADGNVAYLYIDQGVADTADSSLRLLPLDAATGAVVAGAQPTTLSAASDVSFDSLDFDYAGNANGGLAVYGSLGSGVVRVKPVSPNGGDGGPVQTISPENDSSRGVSVTTIAGDFAVSYLDQTTGAIRVAFVGPSGTLLNTIDVGTAKNIKRVRTKIRRAGDKLLVVWSDVVDPEAPAVQDPTMPDAPLQGGAVLANRMTCTPDTSQASQ